MRSASVFAALIATVLLAAPPALAHKVVLSVYAAGDGIEGELGFSNGEMAVDTPVTVTAPDGRVLGETRTDADGFFTFTPSEAVAHVFQADLGAGHVAEIRMPVADLPAGLRAPVAGTAPQPAASVEAVSGDASLTPDLREAIAAAVRDEVRPLRRELAAYKEKNDLQSILGGLGYIAGLFGVAFYLVGRQRLKRA